jgi:hypothetical protein
MSFQVPDIAEIARRFEFSPATGGALPLRAPLNLNTATEREIQVLRGIGRANAARIVAARPFKDAYELVTRGIIPEGIYDKIAASLVVGSARDASRTAAARQDVSSRRARPGRA